MKKLKTFAFYAAVVLTVGLLGLAFWLDTRAPPDQAPRPSPQQSTRAPSPTTPEPLELPGTGDNAEPYVLRKCLASDGEPTFMVTRDSSCEIVDGNGTVSVTGRIPKSPDYQKRKQAEQAATRRQAQQSTRGEPNIRLTGKSPPRGTSRECKFPIGRALEIERPLSVAKNAFESVWREEYCEWVNEAVSLSCAGLRETLHFEKLCFGF